METKQYKEFAVNLKFEKAKKGAVSKAIKPMGPWHAHCSPDIRDVDDAGKVEIFLQGKVYEPDWETFEKVMKTIEKYLNIPPEVHSFEEQWEGSRHIKTRPID